MRYAVAGATGMIGRNLAAMLTAAGHDVVALGRANFADVPTLAQAIEGSDAVFHCAGVSRSDDPQMMYDTNMQLCRMLAGAVDGLTAGPTLVFVSTTHDKPTKYHQSKRDGETLFANCIFMNGARAVSVRSPNTFGPGGRPFYNSVVSTFCDQLCRGEMPKIQTDGEIELIYVGKLVRQLLQIANDPASPAIVTLQAPYRIKVSELLARLRSLLAGCVPTDDLDFDLVATLDHYRGATMSSHGNKRG